MPELSRRQILHMSGAAAVAVPMSALVASSPAEAAQSRGEAAAPARGGHAESAEPVMFVIQDAKRGEVAILHGEREVVVRDRSLVARILTATRSARGEE